MRAAIFYLVGAALLYFGLRSEAPTPELPWEPYAASSSTGRLVWLLAGPYRTHDECTFNAEKEVKNSSDYREPKGCLYMGYQNPYVQWLVNTAVGAGKFRCIALKKNRNKYDDPIYEPLLGGYTLDHGDNWECYLPAHPDSTAR